MKPRDFSSRFLNYSFPSVLVVLTTALLVSTVNVSLGQQNVPPAAQSQVMTNTGTTDSSLPPPIPPDQLDSLVAPIALFSDSLLAQTLAASTYPLGIVQLQQWMDQNKNLQGQALSDGVSKLNLDPS